MNAQTLGPRLAGTLGWEAEYTGCCGHCLLLGGLRCGGPVLPKPGVGLGPQLPVRGEDACVPADRGNVCLSFHLVQADVSVTFLFAQE